MAGTFLTVPRKVRRSEEAVSETAALSSSIIDTNILCKRWWKQRTGRMKGKMKEGKRHQSGRRGGIRTPGYLRAQQLISL